MKTFNYKALENKTWDNEIMGLLSFIHEERGKQALYLMNAHQPADFSSADDLYKYRQFYLPSVP